MALDAITLSMVAGELKAALLGCKVDKVSQPTHDEVVLQLRAYKGSLRLLCSARQGAARVGLTEEKFENPSTAPSFCMLLRKYLCGGRISDIKSVDGERIVLIEMDCTNEMADKVSLTFAVELMGRYSNLVLYYTGGKVIDALKRIDFEASDVRQLLPGLTYTLPPVQDRVFFADITPETLIEKIKETDVPVGDAIMRICSGIGPVVAREIAYRAFGGGEVYGKEMTVDQIKTLENVIVSVKNDIAQGNVHCMVKNDTGKPIEFSFTPLNQYEGGEKVCTLEYFDNFGELLDAYYSTKDRQERLTQKSKELTKAVKNMHERALRKQIARKEELAQSRDCENLRIMGEVLQA
ncbi:MAG: NFACT family protein, partial [Oscillospiraceae bacterium]